MKRIIIWSRAQHLHLFALISLQRKKAERYPTKICPFDNGARLRHLLRSIILGDEKKQKLRTNSQSWPFSAQLLPINLDYPLACNTKLILTHKFWETSLQGLWFKLKKSILYCLESCKLYFTFYLVDCTTFHFLEDLTHVDDYNELFLDLRKMFWLFNVIYNFKEPSCGSTT